jgi:2',3'-cyclic-nucleotide 3'-phosphodiesterase
VALLANQRLAVHHDLIASSINVIRLPIPNIEIVTMPGSSLWLLPPKSHPLSSIISCLIEQIPSRFDSPHRFLPHVTITSEIPPSTHSPNPQAWLDSLDLPSASTVQVRFGKLASEDVFFRKLYVTCAKGEGLEELAVVCRQKVEGFEDEKLAEAWASKKYNPHLSLMYHDCPPIDAGGLSEVEQTVQEAGISLKGDGDLGGWTGGIVVVVPTDKSINEWDPLAQRDL